MGEKVSEKTELALGWWAVRNLILVVKTGKKGPEVPTYGGFHHSHRGPPASVGHPRLPGLTSHRTEDRGRGRDTNHVRTTRVTWVVRGIGVFPGVRRPPTVVTTGRTVVASRVTPGGAAAVNGVTALEVFLKLAGFSAPSAGVNIA